MKKLSYFIVVVLLFGFAFTWASIANAEANCTVSDDESLTRCLTNANDGDTIKVNDFNGTSQKVYTIDKGVTIEAVNSGKGYPTFGGTFVISGTDTSKKVTLKNIKINMSISEYSEGFRSIRVDSPVDLTIDGLTANYGTRETGLETYRTIDISKTADGMTLNLNNSFIQAYYEALRVSSSNSKINITNSTLFGKYALAIGNEEDSEQKNNNEVNIKGSTISGASSKELEAAIMIGGQNNLKLNIGNNGDKASEINNSLNQENLGKASAADLIRFYNGKSNNLTNTNVTINISDKTVLDDEGQVDVSHIFHFGDGTKDSGNVINLGKDVIVEKNNSEEMELSKKYNTDQSAYYYIVGLYSYDGSAVVKQYSIGEASGKVGEAIKTLESDAYSNRYKIVGWYSNDKLTNSFTTEPVSITSNIDIYPKAVKLYKVTIGGETYDIEDGKTLSSNSQAQDKLNSLKSVDDKVFTKFYKQGDEEKTEIKEDETPIQEDMTIEALYNVKITVKDDSEANEFLIPEGGSLKDLDSDNLGKLNKLKENTEKDFKEFVYGEENTVVIEDGDDATTFDKNTELERKYTVNVTIDGEDYKIDEGQELSTLNTLYDNILTNLQNATNDGKREFKEFRDKNTKSKVELSETITKHITIEPVYQVEITIGEAKVKVEEGTTWESLKNTASSELDTLKNTNLSRFAKFVVGESTLLTDEYTFNENCEIKAKFNVKITIDENELTLVEGETLQSLSSEDKEKLNKYKEASNKTFYQFEKSGTKDVINENETTFDEDTTIVAVYHVTVKIGDETFTLRDDESLNSLTGEDKTKLDNLTDGHGEKDFDRFEDKEKNQIKKETIITENKELDVIFKVNITIGGDSVTVDEGTTYEDLEKIPDAKGKLDTLKTTKDKEFAYFVDSDGDILDSNHKSHTFNKHTTISPRYYITVTISNNGETLKLVEGQKLSDLDGENLTKLNNIKNASNKTFKRFEENDNPIIENEKTFNDDTTLFAVYDIKITIKDKEFTIENKDTLSVLNDKLNEFKNVEGKNFKGFKKDEAFIDEKSDKFTENTTLVPNYTITITIDEQTFEDISDDKTFGELKEISGIKEKLDSLKTDRFAYYEFDGNKINDDTLISVNSKIVPKYYIYLTVGSDSGLRLVEGQKLSDLSSTDKEKLAKYENVDSKTFKHYVSNGKEVTDETTFNEDVTLEPKYTITVTIGDEKFVIDEGESLESINNEDKNRLQALKNINGKDFLYFTKDGVEFMEDEALNSHITLVPVYMVTITINNQEFRVLEGTSYYDLLENEEFKKQLEEAKKAENKKFAHFVDDNNNIIDDDTVFNFHTMIKARYYITIKIVDKEFTLEEGETLNDLSDEEKEILTSLKEASEGKEFSHYIDKNTNEEIYDDTQLYDDTSLEIVFKDIKPSENPLTYDNILGYISTLIIVMLGFGITTKKMLNK